MPWKNDADSVAHNKNATGEHGAAWRHVANGVLARTGDDARAIREANAVLASRMGKKRFGKKTK